MFLFFCTPSKKRRELITSLNNTGEDLTILLIKALLSYGTEYYNHWREAIYTHLHNIGQDPLTGTWPTKKLILRSITCEFVYSAYQIAISKDDVKNVDRRKIEKAITQYKEWIADRLSRFGVVNHYQVQHQVDELAQGIQ